MARPALQALPGGTVAEEIVVTAETPKYGDPITGDERADIRVVQDHQVSIGAGNGIGAVVVVPAVQGEEPMRVGIPDSVRIGPGVVAVVASERGAHGVGDLVVVEDS